MSEDEMSSESEYSSAPHSKEVYNIAFKSIRTKGDIPLARSNFSLTRLNKTRLFLFGGCNEEQDFNDAYFLDLVLMRWTQVDVGMKLPLVGHVSACLYRGFSESRPYVYIFGGWDGAAYSDKGILINPETLEVLTSNYNDPVMEWSNASKGSYTYSGGSNSSSISNNFGNLGSLVARTPNARLESNTANRKNNSGTFPSPRPSNAKSITWIASVRGDKGKTETNIKKLFAEKIPFSRRDHTLTFDPESHKLYLYGGWNSISWAYDESKFLDVWSLDSNWRWNKENIKGDIPTSRRGHSAVYLPKQRSIIIYGGCSGSNALLGDCYEYLIETGLFTRIAMKDPSTWPAGRAWHSAELIGHIIYYYGGLVTDFTTTKEVIAFDTYDYEWRHVNCISHEDILDIERFGHSSFHLDQSILVLGGTVYEHEDKDNDLLSSGSLLERKISLADLLVIETLDTVETDDVRTFEKSLDQAIQETKNTESQMTKTAKERNPEEELQPPPIPSQFLNPLKLLEDQANFLHWNPHIFPSEINKSKIQYFKKKIEEETINRNNLPQYPEFEGLGDEESSFSLASIKNQTSEALSDYQEKKQSNP